MIRPRPFLEALRRWWAARTERQEPTPPPAAAPAPPPAPPPPTVDVYARSSLEKAERKLVELDWRLHAVEAERDVHARPRGRGRSS